ASPRPDQHPHPSSCSQRAWGHLFQAASCSLAATPPPSTNKTPSPAPPLPPPPTIKTFLPASSTLYYRSFSVDRLNSANKIARIKNRKTIFDSFQSCISKW